MDKYNHIGCIYNIYLWNGVFNASSNRHSKEMHSRIGYICLPSLSILFYILMMGLEQCHIPTNIIPVIVNMGVGVCCREGHHRRQQHYQLHQQH